MPYPDHFSQDGTYRPWEHPYETITTGRSRPQRVRPRRPPPPLFGRGSGGHDAIRPPYNTYGADEIGAEIRHWRMRAQAADSWRGTPCAA
ncbi:MAG: hypothetical protein ACLR8L_00345 [Oscillospiraceae bacterium]